MRVRGTRCNVLEFTGCGKPRVDGVRTRGRQGGRGCTDGPSVSGDQEGLGCRFVRPIKGCQTRSGQLVRRCKYQAHGSDMHIIRILVATAPRFFGNGGGDRVETCFRATLRFVRGCRSSRAVLSTIIRVSRGAPRVRLSFIPVARSKELYTGRVLKGGGGLA